jgi:hypothetical protein
MHDSGWGTSRGFKAYFFGGAGTAFIIHGEPQDADVLRHNLEGAFSWNCVVPDQAQSVELA